jgi:hypothetical protein
MALEAVAPRAEASSLDPVGMMTRIQNRVRSLPQDLSNAKSMLRENQRRLAQVEKKIGAPFEFESELNEKLAEREQLQAEMAAESKAPANDQPSSDVAASTLVGPELEAPQLTDAQLDKFWSEAERIVKQIIPNGADKGLSLKAAEALVSKGHPVQGFYNKRSRLIAIAYNISQAHPFVLAHETVHAMKALGLFTPTEWKLLVNDAWTLNPKMRASVKERWAYQNLGEEQLQEEAVAEHFGDYFDLTEGNGWKGRLARRVLNFFVKLADAFNRITGKGDRTAIDAHSVLELMRQGKIGARPEGFGSPVDNGGLAFSVSGNEARWTDKRIGRLLEQYAVSHRQTKTKSYVAWISPKQFLDITTPAGDQQAAIRGNAVVDNDRLERESQTPFLLVKEVGAPGGGFFRTVGHEGRHRMASLEKAGVARVPVVIERTDIGWSELKPTLGYLSAQRYSNDFKGAGGADLGDLTPLTYANEAQIRQQFGGDGDVRFSVAEPLTPATPPLAGSQWRTGRRSRHPHPGQGGVQGFRAGLEPALRAFAEQPAFLQRQGAASQAGGRAGGCLREDRPLPHQLVGKPQPKEYDVFKRKIVLDDLMWEADAEHQLPFGFTPESLRKPAPTSTASPRPCRRSLRQSARKLANRRLADEMVNRACCAPIRSRTRPTTATWYWTMPGRRSRPRRTAGP